MEELKRKKIVSLSTATVLIIAFSVCLGSAVWFFNPHAGTDIIIAIMVGAALGVYTSWELFKP